MNEQRKIEKLIQEQDAEMRERILSRIHEKHPELNVQKEKPKKSFGWLRIATAVCSACVLVCAIVIPSVVLGGGEEHQPPNRYCDINSYLQQNCDYTLKQYNERENKNVLYLDWYDKAMQCMTGAYIENATNDILGLFEIFEDEETGSTAEIEAVFKGITLVGVSWNEVVYNDYVINDIAIKWTKKENSTLCAFAYGEYEYIVTVLYEQDETKLFEIVEELLK